MTYTIMKCTKKTEQHFLPSARCRSPRTRWVDQDYQIELRTLTPEEFPVAMIVTSGIAHHREDVRVYEGVLYRKNERYEKPEDTMRCLGDDWGKRENPEYVPDRSVVLETLTQVVESSIADIEREFVVYDGSVWHPSTEPRYTIQESGGYTWLTVDWDSYRSRYPDTFNAMQRDEAIARCRNMARDFGRPRPVEEIADTSDNIEVLLPETIQFDPVMDTEHPLQNMCMEAIRMYDAIHAYEDALVDIHDADTILADLYPDAEGETGMAVPWAAAAEAGRKAGGAAAVCDEGEGVQEAAVEGLENMLEM